MKQMQWACVDYTMLYLAQVWVRIVAAAVGRGGRLHLRGHPAGDAGHRLAVHGQRPGLHLLQGLPGGLHAGTRRPQAFGRPELMIGCFSFVVSISEYVKSWDTHRCAVVADLLLGMWHQLLRHSDTTWRCHAPKTCVQLFDPSNVSCACNPKGRSVLCRRWWAGCMQTSSAGC